MNDPLEVLRPRRPWARYVTVLYVIALVFSAFAIAFAGRGTGSAPGPTITAVGPRHNFYIGTVTLTIQTTNPLQYTLVDEYYIVGGVYSFLINYGPNWELEPDLAVRWSQTNTAPSTWEFHLAKNAYFVDPRGCTSDAQGHIVDCPVKTQVKATDVKFTWDYVKRNQDATTYFKPCTEHVASVDLSPTDPFFVKITYDGPYAAAIASLTCVPILPQYVWSPSGADVAVDWTNALPIGSGPYMVRPVGSTFQMVAPPPLILDRNPVWHGKEVQGRQVFPDTTQFVNYETSGSMSVDLTLGKIDLALSPESQDYLGFLNGKPGILRQALPDGFEAEQAINVLPDALRASFAAISKRPLERGHTNPVLLNQVVRTAIHMATDRQKMIQNAWNGLASPGDTLLPAFHPWHTSIPPYSSDDKNGDGNPFDFPPFIPLDSPASNIEQFPDGPDAPAMARTMLVQAGWAYVCATGALQTGIEFPLCRKDTAGRMVDNLDFRLSTFSSPPWWETAARGVVADAASAGIALGQGTKLELLNGAQMYSLWYQLDYDVWLWDWVWTPITDASLALVVQTCGGIVTLDNDNGFCLRDSAGRWTFDDLYNQTLKETNPVARQALSDRMQRIVYNFASYNLPFYLNQLYGMNQVRFTNWVDFSQFRAVPVDVGNSPLLGQIVYPVDQRPPQFTLSRFEGVVGRPVQFSASAVDPDGGPLRYRWDFDANRVTGTEPGGAGVNGDGIFDNDDQGGNTPTPTATFNTAGTYDVVLRVSEDGGDFFTVQRTQVTIQPVGTGSPKITGMTFSPFDPTTEVGDVVTIAAAASDPAGNTITQYTWNWGDGSAVQTTTGPTASHQYTTAGTYTAQLTVRSTSGASSSSTIVPVANNVAPVVAPLESKPVLVNAPETFAAFASDANTRDVLTYVWDFGDGTAAGTGNPVTHTYTVQSAQYTMRVTVSDGHGHSASSTATINVVSDKNTRPRITSLTSTPASTWTTMPVQLSATVTDGEGNVLTWEWDFNNDGITDKQYTTPLSVPGQAQTKTETYQYTTAGTARARLTLTDQPPSGTPLSTSTFVSITVTANTVPTLTDLSKSPATGIAGQDFTFASTSNDANGDRLTYTWDFGDGTTATGQTGFFGGAITGKHAYATEGDKVVVLVVNDGKGGEARKSTLVTVAQAALLRVTTNPAVNGKILVDGVPSDEWGLTWMKIAPGTHTVSFGDVNGYGTPAAQTVTSTSGVTTTVQGNYVRYGSLRVITSPALAATISVNGAPADDWGVWRAAAAGTYTIHFGPVADYLPPADQTVTVTAGVLTTATGTYTPSPGAPGPNPSTYGLLRVTTNPAVPAQILVNGIPRDDWGLAWVKLAPGTYTVSFTGAYGVTPPAPATVTVGAGATTTYNAQFTVHGSLRVLTSPALPGTIFVNGIPRDDWGMWQSMPPGTYTVSFGPVPGYTTPAAQTATVTSNVLTTITGPYVPLATVTSSTTTSLGYLAAPIAAPPSTPDAAAPSIETEAVSVSQATASPYAADGHVALTKFESS